MVEYIFSQGWRHVVPYYHKYVTTSKGRWLNRKLLDVFVDEFHCEDANVRKDIETGILGLQLGNEQLGCDHSMTALITGKHRVVNKVHRHEPPVPGEAPMSSEDIVYEDSEVIVVDKPMGVPTHASGAFNYNTLVEIVSSDLTNGLRVYPCHRLDSSTSGIIILAKDSKVVKNYSRSLLQLTSKIYLALVDGEFPSKTEFIKVKQAVFNINTVNGTIEQYERLPNDSKTLFKRLSFDASTGRSLVMCKPLTGKTHQIRIHLRNLGYPIANDIRYNSRIGSEVNKLANTIEQSIYSEINDSVAFVNLLDLKTWPKKKKQIEKLTEIKKDELKRARESLGEICPECRKTIIKKDAGSDRGIYLHSFSYSVDNKRFTTRIPTWAQGISTEQIMLEEKAQIHDR